MKRGNARVISKRLQSLEDRLLGPKVLNRLRFSLLTPSA